MNCIGSYLDIIKLNYNLGTSSFYFNADDFGIGIWFTQNRPMFRHIFPKLTYDKRCKIPSIYLFNPWELYCFKICKDDPYNTLYILRFYSCYDGAVVTYTVDFDNISGYFETRFTEYRQTIEIEF